MNLLILFLLCASFSSYPFADGSTDIGSNDDKINMLYGIIDIQEIMPEIDYYDMIITS